MKHDPKTCPQCVPLNARLRHPAYRRVRSLLVLPTPRRGGAA